jgi:hypothetical protein
MLIDRWEDSWPEGVLYTGIFICLLFFPIVLFLAYSLWIAPALFGYAEESIRAQQTGIDALGSVVQAGNFITCLIPGGVLALYYYFLYRKFTE